MINDGEAVVRRRRASGPMRRIVIVGGGLAGLTCAIACAQAGARVELIEAADMRPRRPAHFEIVPNLLRDLSSLHVAEECARRGFAYSDVRVVDEEGALHFDVPAARLAGPRLPPAVGMTYDDFIDVLVARARNLGVAWRAGQRALAVDVDSGRVELSAGVSVQGDLTVLATGAGSPLVESFFKPARDRAAPTQWWHALLPRPAALDHALWMAGSLGRRLLLVPVAVAQAGIAIVRTESMGGSVDAASMVDTLSSWGAYPKRLAALIPPGSPTIVRDSPGGCIEGPWCRGAVLCVGASAHAVAPPFGQAAAQAVEDAVVLGELISQGLDRPDLLAAFMERRGERARQVFHLVAKAMRWIDQPDASTDLLGVAREINTIVATPA